MLEKTPYISTLPSYIVTIQGSCGIASSCKRFHFIDTYMNSHFRKIIYKTRQAINSYNKNQTPKNWKKFT